MRKNQNRLQVRRLKLKPLDYFMLIGATVSIIMLLVGLSTYMENAKTSQLNLIQEVMTNEAHNLKIQFEDLLDEKVELLQALVTYPEIYEMDEEKQKEFIRYRSDEFGFSHMFIMNKNGQGYYIDEDVHRDQSGEKFFYDVMYKEVFIAEPFYTETGDVFTTICVSIYNKNNEKVGALCGALRLDNIQKLIADNEMVLDGKCFILDKEGKYLTSDRTVDVTYQVSVFDKEDSETSLIQKALTEEKDQKGIVTIEGIEYQSNVTYLEEFNWLIVQSIPTSEIVARFSTLNILQNSLSISIFILICCIVRIIYRWYKNVNKIYMDTLTKCNSRAACLDLIDNIEKKYNHRITFLYMDLNRFKYVNDTFGHDKGDELLCVFSKAIEETFGEIGFVGRMGGDEFISILEDVSDADIEAMWSKLEALLVERSALLDIPYVITSSYGYASREKNEKETLESLMTKADTKMYEYKALYRKTVEDSNS
ncbi:MAG: GGDEF domain-containing protein [Agathobacter sp.]|nr:GGDEF domain-containing protein [Agathobacter sp.]